MSTRRARVARRFGPDAIRTPANAITFARLLFTIPVLMMILGDDPGAGSWNTFTGWLVLWVTDGIDGWFARRDGTTRSGAFLDPLADKILVLGGFVALGIRGDIAWLPVAIIAGREAIVSLYRTLEGRRGVSVPARRLGKWKANVQFVAVALVLFPPTSDLGWLHDTALWAAVAFTVVSGLDLFQAARRPGGACAVRCDVLAIGTELLLGQIVDTNSAWIGEQLATAGIDTYDHRKVGDNLARMVAALRDLLVEADAVIVCGGLGPTPDDVTREAIAEVMGVELERHEDLVEQIAAHVRRARPRHAGQQPAPGRRPGRRRRDPEPDRHRAGPAVRDPGPTARSPTARRRSCTRCRACPYEMQQMVTDFVLPDLLERSGEQLGRSCRGR